MDIFCIGDIHGMISKFDKLWNTAKPSKDTLIISLGDLVDRGSNSKEVVQRFIDLSADGYNIKSIMGNHDHVFLHYATKKPIDWNDGKIPRDPTEQFFRNGGKFTLQSYGKNIPKSHINFLKKLPFFIETDKFIFVHGGVKPGVPLKKQNVIELMWIREPFLSSITGFKKTIVFGHTITCCINYFKNGFDTFEPFFGKGKIGLDTGCVFGGKLTGMWLPSTEYISV